jgi:hypothetical protein
MGIVGCMDMARPNQRPAPDSTFILMHMWTAQTSGFVGPARRTPILAQKLFRKPLFKGDNT